MLHGLFQGLEPGLLEFFVPDLFDTVVEEHPVGICAAAMVGVIAFGSLVPFVIVNVLFFAFYFVSLPLAQNRVAELGKGKDSNLVMGSLNAVKSFGSIFGSALAGFLYEAHAKLPFVFGFGAFLIATVFMMMFAATEKKQKA